MCEETLTGRPHDTSVQKATNDNETDPKIFSFHVHIALLQKDHKRITIFTVSDSLTIIHHKQYWSLVIYMPITNQGYETVQGLMNMGNQYTRSKNQ